MCCTNQWPAKSICFSHTSAVNTLMLLIKVSATVTVYRGHRWTLFYLPSIISLFIMCIEIIRNNSMVGRRIRTEVWTPAAEHITLYCTWHPSALTTGLHGHVRRGGVIYWNNNDCGGNLPTDWLHTWGVRVIYHEADGWVIYREIDDGSVAESSSHNSMQNLFRVVTDDHHDFIDDDNSWLTEDDTSKTQ